MAVAVSVRRLHGVVFLFLRVSTADISVFVGGGGPFGFGLCFLRIPIDRNIVFGSDALEPLFGSLGTAFGVGLRADSDSSALDVLLVFGLLFC